MPGALRMCVTYAGTQITFNLDLYRSNIAMDLKWCYFEFPKTLAKQLNERIELSLYFCFKFRVGVVSNANC